MLKINLEAQEIWKNRNHRPQNHLAWFGRCSGLHPQDRGFLGVFSADWD